MSYCRDCTCPATNDLHEARCPYLYDRDLWRFDQAWVVVGTGALAGEVTQAIGRMGHGVVAYVVDDGYRSEARAIRWWGDRAGAPTILSLSEYHARYAEFARARVAVGVGDPATRLRFSDLASEHGWREDVVRDPAAVVMPGATVRGGAVLSAGVVVSHGAHVGEHVLVNYNVTIGHDVKISAGTMVCPGAQLMGNVEVGERVFVGTGAIFLPGVKVGASAVVGAGAVVIRDVPVGATVVGNPARVLEKR